MTYKYKVHILQSKNYAYCGMGIYPNIKFSHRINDVTCKLCLKIMGVKE